MRSRCYLHNCHAGEPLAVEATPRPSTEAEAFELATEERFSKYQSSGGQSASMLDHYYDKLLVVARPPAAIVRNSYLEAEAHNRAAPLLAVCLAYSKAGIVPIDEIEATVTRLGLRQTDEAADGEKPATKRLKTAK